MEERKLKVNALKNGTVIDHIPAGNVLKVSKLLNLEDYNKTVTLGMNLKSSKYKYKDILKIEDRYLDQDEANKLSLIAPDATINIIKDWKVDKKIKVAIPDTICGLKCANPRCITRHDSIKTKFHVLNTEKSKFRCHFCEHVFDKKDLIKNIG